MVRLFAYDGRPLGETEIRIPQVRRRTIRHRGILYELIAEKDGVRDYRATEPVPVMTRSAAVMNHVGSTIGALTIPVDETPATMPFHGVDCPLWSTRDQEGRIVYLKPEPADGV